LASQPESLKQGQLIDIRALNLYILHIFTVPKITHFCTEYKEKVDIFRHSKCKIRTFPMPKYITFESSVSKECTTTFTDFIEGVQEK
jgi:hypothetical protein